MPAPHSAARVITFTPAHPQSVNPSFPPSPENPDGLTERQTDSRTRAHQLLQELQLHHPADLLAGRDLDQVIAVSRRLLRMKRAGRLNHVRDLETYLEACLDREAAGQRPRPARLPDRDHRKPAPPEDPHPPRTPPAEPAQPAAARAWGEVLAQLETQVPRPNFVTLLEPTTGHTITNQVLTVLTPNELVAEMLEERLIASVLHAAEAHGISDVTFAVASGAGPIGG